MQDAFACRVERGEVHLNSLKPDSVWIGRKQELPNEDRVGNINVIKNAEVSRYIRKLTVDTTITIDVVTDVNPKMSLLWFLEVSFAAETYGFTLYCM